MIAILNDNQWIYLDHVTPYEDNILWEEFSVSRLKPGIYVDPSQMGSWDGVYRKYNRAKQRLARPYLSLLRGVCQKHNLSITVRDNRKPWPYQVLSPDQIGKDFLPGITLEDFQVNCIKKGIVTEVGTIDIPTGGGKGEMIAGFCKAISCPTLVLADQRVVIDQLKQRLELRDVAEKVGIFYAGKRPSGEMVIVGSIQSLTLPSAPPGIMVRSNVETDEQYEKRAIQWDKKFQAYKTRRDNAKILVQYARKAEMLIVDEADKAVSDPWKMLFRHYFRGRRRYGFSGTIYDPEKPVEAMIVQEHLGSVIFKEVKSTLIKLGRIVPCECFMLPVGLDGSIHEASAYDIAFEEKIIQNTRYHKLIARLCVKSKRQEGDGTLILVDREALGYRLVEEVRAAGLKAEFIFGKTSPKKRNQILRDFESRKIDVLVGGKIIDRGLDLKGGCETLIVACGGKLKSPLIQRIGRAVRLNRRGKGTIYLFLFRNNKYLYDHSKSNLKTLVGSGEKVTIVFPGGVLDGADYIKSRFQIKKALLTSKPKPPSLFQQQEEQD